MQKDNKIFIIAYCVILLDVINSKNKDNRNIRAILLDNITDNFT